MIIVKVSHSKLETWDRCRYCYNLRYVKRLEPVNKAGALSRGTIIHACLEAYNSGRSWTKEFKKQSQEYYKKTSKELVAVQGDMAKLAQTLMEGYVEFYKEDNLEYLENEYNFEISLTDTIALEGYIDSITRDITGIIDTFETKTYSKFPQRNMLIFNQQSAIYTKALQEKYPKETIGGTIWNIIKAKYPSEPKINKDGKPSIAKIDTTPYHLKKWFEESGIDSKEYTKLFDMALYENYYWRVKTRIQPKMVDQILRDCKLKALDIKKYGNTRKERRLTKDCSWCEFKPICHAELSGLEVEDIIKRDYKEREEVNGKKKSKTKEAK